uniref:DUF1566 domain-containing protein n=1 Tax=uncultured bacterium contig00085 TaxID=1181558 RepID=A0A806JZ49_9BACT|nr:hypothetical protein [uncultured bacterium contig00085]
MKTTKHFLVAAAFAALALFACSGDSSSSVDGSSSSGGDSSSSEGGSSYAVGDTGPGGGIIFYYNEEGFTVWGYGEPGLPGYFATYTANYLEVVSTGNIFSLQWGDENTLVSGVSTYDSWGSRDLIKSTTLGYGRKNTQILAAHMNGKSITGTGAQACANYTAGGKDDWFLPSIGEMIMLVDIYEAGIPGNEEWQLFSLTSNYLSSTQRNEYWGWMSMNGNAMNLSKSTSTYSARPIRAF